MPKVKNKLAAQQPIKPQESKAPAAAKREPEAAVSADRYVPREKESLTMLGQISTFLPSTERDNLARTGKAVRKVILEADARLVKFGTVYKFLEAFQKVSPTVASKITSCPLQIKVGSEDQAGQLLDFITAQKQMPVKIESLSFKRRGVGEKGLKLLGAITGLKRLRIDSCNLDLTQVQLLANMGNLSSLLQLNIAANRLGDAGVKVIAANKHFSKLQKLNIARVQMGSAGASAIAESEYMENLQQLNVNDNRIADKGAVAFAASPYLANLKRLDIGSNQIGDEGAKAIVGSKYLVNLQDMNVEHHNIGVDGHMALRTSMHTMGLAIRGL